MKKKENKEFTPTQKLIGLLTSTTIITMLIWLLLWSIKGIIKMLE
tara:strand:+ start:2279 stop:2413 length:135 start_codon:yes stop_codon:yes gene_type:complete